MRDFREPKGWKLIGVMNAGSSMYGETSAPDMRKEASTMKKLRKMKPTSADDLLQEKLDAEAAMTARKEFEKRKPRTKGKKKAATA